MLGNVLNTRITIEVGTESKNASGTPTLTYAKLKDTYAGVTYNSGGRANDEGGTYVYSDVDFNVRYDSNITYKCRILYQGQYYRIVHILPCGLRDGLKIKTIYFEE